jgi:hypothetical protein
LATIERLVKQLELIDRLRLPLDGQSMVACVGASTHESKSAKERTGEDCPIPQTAVLVAKVASIRERRRRRVA